MVTALGSLFQMTYPDVCVIPISVMVQQLMNQYEAGKQLSTKASQAAKNSKGSKSQRLFISLYKNSSASLMHQKTHNRAGSRTPVSH